MFGEERSGRTRGMEAGFSPEFFLSLASCSPALRDLLPEAPGLVREASQL